MITGGFTIRASNALARRRNGRGSAEQIRLPNPIHRKMRSVLQSDNFTDQLPLEKKLFAADTVHIQEISMF